MLSPPSPPPPPVSAIFCSYLLQVIIQQDFDIRDPAEIAAHCADANLVINLVGVHQETWNFGFSEVHVDFAKAIAEAAAATPSVERLLHVSCLGASPKAPSQRLQTKARLFR